MNQTNNIVTVGAVFDGRYKLLKPLSSDGGTADVWLALDTNTIDEVYDGADDRITSSEETGIRVAIKIYRPKNALDLGEQRFREEFKIVFNCHHTNLVQPINFSIFKGVPYLVLPYCEKGSSERLQGIAWSKDELWRYIGDVSAGLAYLHAFSPTIVHHDIKPANVLIDDSNTFAITDFGISSQRGLNRDGYDDNPSGTMAYMAPERFRQDYQSTPESDIWSFGATLYELITGKVPFGEDGGLAQLEGTMTLEPIGQSVPSDIRKLINDCLSPDPAQRPRADYICKCAAKKQYPLRKFPVKATIAALLGAAAIATVFIFYPADEKEKATEKPKEQAHAVDAARPLTPEQRYTQAAQMLASADVQSLNDGLAIMDSLGNTGFVPALYEQVFTYGWYSDSASLSRKELLGIELLPSLLPRSQQINAKAIGLLSRIEELNDEHYPQINANALYRLACYYVNDNQVLKQDRARARTLLNNALYWAQKCGDQRLLNRIQSGLDELNME